MAVYWVKLEDGRAGCAVVRVSELSADDRLLSLDDYLTRELGSKILIMKTLPYAAHPLLLGSDMTFCYDPGKCAGHSSCPQRRSCSD